MRQAAKELGMGGCLGSLDLEPLIICLRFLKTISALMRAFSQQIRMA